MNATFFAWSSLQHLRQRLHYNPSAFCRENFVEKCAHVWTERDLSEPFYSTYEFLIEWNASPCGSFFTMENSVLFAPGMNGKRLKFVQYQLFIYLILYKTTLQKTCALPWPGGRGLPQKSWVGVCRPLAKTLTMFMTKIWDFLLPHLWPGEKFDTYLWPLRLPQLP